MQDLEGSAVRRLEELQRDYQTQAREIDNQVVGWALVANAAAMLLCLNALLDHKLCDASTVTQYMRVFLLGIVLVVFKVSASQWVAERAHLVLINISAAFREFKVAAAETNDDSKRSELSTRLIKQIGDAAGSQGNLRRIERLANLALAGSLLCFGGAVFYAVNSNALVLALCPANP